MSVIAGIAFCNDCGNLLERTRALSIKCDVCGSRNKVPPIHETVQVSRPEDYPSKLREKRSAIGKKMDDHAQAAQGPIAEKTCPKCGAEEMRYAEVQMRSADEGSTVFYFCTCGHRFSENN